MPQSTAGNLALSLRPSSAIQSDGSTINASWYLAYRAGTSPNKDRISGFHKLSPLSTQPPEVVVLREEDFYNRLGNSDYDGLPAETAHGCQQANNAGFITFLILQMGRWLRLQSII